MTWTIRQVPGYRIYFIISFVVFLANIHRVSGSDLDVERVLATVNIVRFHLWYHYEIYREFERLRLENGIHIQLLVLKASRECIGLEKASTDQLVSN